MKSQILFSKKIVNLLSAQFAHLMLNVYRGPICNPTLELRCIWTEMLSIK